MCATSLWMIFSASNRARSWMRLREEGPGTRFVPLSHCGVLHHLRRLRVVEFPVALFDAASPLVAGDGGADMVRASSLACSGDFLLRLAICESEHLVAKGG